jgi:hypothetical protein
VTCVLSLFIITYGLDSSNVTLAPHELLDDGSIVERGREPGHEVSLFLAWVSRVVRERRSGHRCQCGVGEGRVVLCRGAE